MILDVSEHARYYLNLSVGFDNAFKFLSNPGLKELPPGKYEIDGDRIFALVSKNPGRKKEEAQLEIHQKYIDIQLILSGIDQMGWKPASACRQPATDYDDQKDIQFFADQPDAWIPVKSGMFVIFFPEDAHQPLVSDGDIHKVVVKVAVDRIL